VRVSITSRRY